MYHFLFVLLMTIYFPVLVEFILQFLVFHFIVFQSPSCHLGFYHRYDDDHRNRHHYCYYYYYSERQAGIEGNDLNVGYICILA